MIGVARSMVLALVACVTWLAPLAAETPALIDAAPASSARIEPVAGAFPCPVEAARVAVGFTSGSLRDGVWTVTDHDAHAWVEAWFAGYGQHEALPDHSSLTRIRQRWGADRFLSCTRFPWTPICPTGDRHGEVQHERDRQRGCG